VGGLVASPWLIGSVVWEPGIVFVLGWSLAAAALVLCVRTTRVRPEIVGVLAGVAVLLLVIAFDNRRSDHSVRLGSPAAVVRIEESLPADHDALGLGFSSDSRRFLQDEPCFDCVDPVPLALAGAGLGAFAVVGYALLVRRTRRRT
jgi:hypothetical protein